MTADLKAARPGSGLFRSGVMRCAKCKFRLIRKVLYIGDGTVGAGTSETEPCPNGCGPLWPVTWKEECQSAEVFAEEQWHRAQDALTALDQAAEALTNAEEDLSVIHRAATHCQGKFGGRMSEVDRVFQEITRVSSMHKVRAATVYATLKPVDTKEGEG